MVRISTTRGHPRVALDQKEQAVELVAHEVAVAGARSPLVQPTSFTAPAARVTAVAGDPGYGQVALALALAGRMPLAGGRVTFGGREDPASLRRHVAVVDVPGVSAPEDGLAVHHVLAEELAFAGRPAGRRAVEAFLTAHGVAARADEPFEALAPADRVRVLAHAAAERTATRVLVLTNPDRRGGDARTWWPDVEALAADGLTVVVQVTHATMRQLELSVTAELGSREAVAA
jgi:ABC-type transport system involved in cytochrome c biogenesis ATPase subunit